jgi:hypothetical protein
LAVLSTVALPTAVFEAVAVWELKRVLEPKFCNWTLRFPRLDPREPRSERLLVSVVFVL